MHSDDKPTKIITKSGRLVVLRLPPKADTSEKINAVSFIRNLRFSWYKCQQAANEKHMSDYELGIIFYQTFQEIFGNCDDIIIVED